MNSVQTGIKPGELTVIMAGKGKGKSMFGEQKTYPDGSVGWYTCHCGCGVEFLGHKRDYICPDCTAKLPKQLELPL